MHQYLLGLSPDFFKFEPRSVYFSASYMNDGRGRVTHLDLESDTIDARD